MRPGRPLPPPPTVVGRTRPGVGLAATGGLVVAALGVGLAVVLSLTAAPAGSRTPEEALRAYLTASQDRDCEELLRHPITGYDDLGECEESEAEEVEQNRDDGIDPDSFTYSIESLEVSQESEDLARVSIDLFVGFDQRGEEQGSGGEQVYEVSRDDDGGWVVDDLAYED